MTTRTTYERRRALLEQLGHQAEQLATSHGWQAWLQFATKFRTYSLNNQLLIRAQCPSATYVAGFRTWVALGRQVRWGEHGIAIIAPTVRRRREAEDPNGDERLVTGYRVAYVFDIAQTDGPDLPPPDQPPVKVPDLALRGQLIMAAETVGIVVKLVDDRGDGVRGWFSHRNQTIGLVQTRSPNSQVRTLLHELAHACDPEVAKLDHDRAERELVAESAMYLVATEMGIDTAAASTQYVTSWGADTKRLLRLAGESLLVATALDGLTSQLVLPGWEL